MEALFLDSVRSGNGGTITVGANQLQLVDGGSITSTMVGSGAGGDAIVDAEVIELRGVTANLSPSIIAANTTNTGNAGSVTINTRKLFVRNGGRIDSSTVDSGDAGCGDRECFRTR